MRIREWIDGWARKVFPAPEENSGARAEGQGAIRYQREVPAMLEVVARHPGGGTLFRLPDNLGQFPVPHVFTFSGVTDLASRIYRPSDEALRASLANARYMLNDPTITECLEQRYRATCLLDWSIEPPEGAGDAEAKIARILGRLLRRIPRFMQYRESLLRAIWYGRAAVVHRWGWTTVEGRPYLTVVSWYPLSGDKLVFRWDENARREELGIKLNPATPMMSDAGPSLLREAIRSQTEVTSMGPAYFLKPWERSLVAVHKHILEDAPYECPEMAGSRHGIGIRSRIYWLWYQKQEILSFLMEFLERSAFGFEIWGYPAGSKEAEERVRQAATQRIGEHRNVVLVPQWPDSAGFGGFNYQRIEPSMAGAEAARVIVEYFSHVIKRYILGQTLTSEAANTGLGSNLGEIHLATFQQIVRYDARNLEESITTDLVRPLLEHNFPEFAEEDFRFVIKTEDENVSERLELLERAYRMGLAVKADDIRKLVGISPPGPEDEVVQLPGEGAEPQSSLPFQYARDDGIEYALPKGLPANPHPMQVVHLKEGSYIWAPSKRNSKVYRWQSLEEGTQHRLFVSPVVEGKKTAQEALEGIQSETHQKAVQKYHRILGMADLHPTTVHDVVGQFGEPEHSFMATFEKFEKDKLTLAACTMGLVSEKPQLGVAMFERISRHRKYGMLTARIARPLEDIDKVMREVQEKTGIYGWTVVPFDGFFEIVLCANQKQLKLAHDTIAAGFPDCKVRRRGGELRYIGHDSDRQQAAQEYIRHIREIAGSRAGRYLRLVAHNIPPKLLSDLAQEERSETNG